jgi:hypothetical protein
VDQVAHTEQIEAEFDRLIEKRHDRRVADGEENRQESFARWWRESEEKYDERLRRQFNAERYRFEMDLCEIHERLAHEHEEKALRVLEDDE